MKDSKIIKITEGKMVELLELMGIEAVIKTEINQKDDRKIVNVVIEGDDLGLIIGYRGNTLKSIQRIFSQIIYNKLDDDVSILVDVNGYRDKRESYLKSLARKAANQAEESGQDVELRPLSAYERRIIHITLKEDDGVSTESKGEGSERRVVIKINS